MRRCLFSLYKRTFKLFDIRLEKILLDDHITTIYYQIQDIKNDKFMSALLTKYSGAVAVEVVVTAATTAYANAEGDITFKEKIQWMFLLNKQ